MALDRMPFGKHKGARLEDVPTDYIQWALEEWDWKDRQALMHELEAQLAMRRGEGVRRGGSR